MKTETNIVEITDGPANVDVTSLTHLSKIIEHYNVISMKLSLFADAVPETEEEQQKSVQEEIKLLDMQADLLETALSRPVDSLEDAKALLTLWHHEVVKARSEDSLTSADEIVNAVFQYLKAV